MDDKRKIAWHDGEFAPFLDKVQSHHVFDFCLEYVKRADMTIISSFAINDSFVRRLIKNRSRLGKLIVLWDTTMATRNPKILYFLAKNVDEVYLTPNHSKVIVMQGSKQVAAISSVNTTGNYRNEGGFVTTNKSLIEFYKNQFEKIFEDSLRWTPPVT